MLVSSLRENSNSLQELAAKIEKDVAELRWFQNEYGGGASGPQGAETYLEYTRRHARELACLVPVARPRRTIGWRSDSSAASEVA